MKNYINKIILGLMVCVCAMVLFSCSEDEPKDKPTAENKPAESTILIYAVATNSLAGNLVADKNEMVLAAENIDLTRHNVIIYQTVYEYDENYIKTGKGESSLIKLTKANGGYGWETIQEYDKETSPLDPKRISEVIDYTVEHFPAQTYGMIFWSHSTASDPYFPSRSTDDGADRPMSYSFGQDLTVSSGSDFYQINVDDLANSLPDNLFHFIWFDSCYMSNIESIYQFRNKCDYFVGYPTEVCDDGMPYNYTLPILASNQPNIVSAAKRLFDYYENEYRYHIATIAVVDIGKIEILRDFCKEIYDGNKSTPSTSSMHKYTNNRQSSGPFYDLGDYSKAIAEENGKELTDEEWENILSECVIYKAATTYDFNNKMIPQERFSGISSYVYKLGDISQKEQFYESLDWFKAVYNNNEAQ